MTLLKKIKKGKTHIWKC